MAGADAPPVGAGACSCGGDRSCAADGLATEIPAGVVAASGVPLLPPCDADVLAPSAAAAAAVATLALLCREFGL
eukprot:2614137-Ditylum_brightwellii.AAC.1